MGLKYYYSFRDTVDILHRVEISNVDFEGDPTEIKGSCTLQYSEIKDILTPVRGSGLKLDLEATTDLDFSDLYSEEERTFSVIYIRDGEILFNGWLSPEGLYRSLVSDRWIVSLDCTDGLGFLENLSYVEDSTGLTFSGKQSALQIISNCLKRTSTPQNILTSIDIHYVGISQLVDTFDNIYFNVNRFVKDDDDTIMNCKEVLSSILDLFGATIASYKGQWIIFKANSLVENTAQSFYRYDSEGVAISPAKEIINFVLKFLGSQIDGYYPHHVNTNQQLNTYRSLGAYRINYKYGLVRSFIENTLLVSNSDTDIPEYTIVDGTYLSFPPDRQGVYIDSISSVVEVLKLTDEISLEKDTFIRFFTRVISDVATNFARFEVRFVGASQTYYLKIDQLLSGDFTQDRVFSGTWETSQNYILFGTYVQNSSTLLEDRPTIEAEALPEDGEIELRVFSSGRTQNPPISFMHIKELSITPTAQNNDIQGENHTFQREDKPSSKIEDVKVVFNGDNPSDIYVGAIYKNDQTTPTEFWTKTNKSEEKPILQIMGEEKMKMNAKPRLIYKGDVYGFFENISAATIIGFTTNKFMPTSYSYDCLRNIVTVTMIEILDEELTDLDYEVTFDYGNVVRPTIRG